MIALRHYIAFLMIEKKLKQSRFRNMAAFSLFLGYSKDNRAGLKQRIYRNIKFLNDTLKHIGLEVSFKEINSSESET
jgi:hypothetical protein